MKEDPRNALIGADNTMFCPYNSEKNPFSYPLPVHVTINSLPDFSDQNHWNQLFSPWVFLRVSLYEYLDKLY